MSQDKTYPSLQFCVLCDGIAEGPDGKPTLIGVFDMFKRPGIVPQFSVAVRWCNGEGSFNTTFKMLNPELQIIVGPIVNEFVLNHRTETTTGFFNFANLNLNQTGVYWIELSIDDNIAISVPFCVYPE